MAPCTLSESPLSELSPCPKRMIFRMSYSYGKHDLWMTWTILKSLQILGSPFDSRVRDALKSSQMRWCTSERYGRTTKHTLPPLSPKNSSCFVWCDLKIATFPHTFCMCSLRWLVLGRQDQVCFDSRCTKVSVQHLRWWEIEHTWQLWIAMGKKGERVLNTYIL